MLSQFIGGAPKLHMLGELDFNFPEGIHAVGRLDYHSEGLLLLTTNPRITKLLFESGIPHDRSYLVQAYKEIGEDTLHQLRTGIRIRIKGGIDFLTTPCRVDVVARPDIFPFGRFEVPRHLPATWLQMTLTEGKYRQIRKMMQAAGHPCRRLIRTSIEAVELGDLPAGGVREIDAADFFRQLNIVMPGSSLA